jgi:hypothetical protein
VLNLPHGTLEEYVHLHGLRVAELQLHGLLAHVHLHRHRLPIRAVVIHLGEDARDLIRRRVVRDHNGCRSSVVAAVKIAAADEAIHGVTNWYSSWPRSFFNVATTCQHGNNSSVAGLKCSR